MLQSISQMIYSNNMTISLSLGDSDTQGDESDTQADESDTQGDEMFLSDLKAAYTICAEKTNGSVTVNHLAEKYLKTHSNDEYRKNLKGKGLKAYLVQSNRFAVLKNIVTIIEGI